MLQTHFFHPARRKPLHGFTLIELLVVISIIALLIAILLPTLSNARATVLGLKCQSNHRSIALGHVMFANDHDGRFARPMYNHQNGYTWRGVSRNGWIIVPWYGQPYVGQYIGNDHVCSTAFSPEVQTPSTKIVYCPSKLSDSPNHAQDIGLSYNNSTRNYFNRTIDPVNRPIVRLDNFAHPARTFLSMDVETDPTQGHTSYRWYRFYYTQSNSYTGNGAIGTGFTTYRHVSTTPVAFADGHAEMVSSDGTDDGGALRAFQDDQLDFRAVQY